MNKNLRLALRYIKMNLSSSLELKFSDMVKMHEIGG